jgi:hypothetical protein
MAAWTMFVCGRGSKALDIATPAPSTEIASLGETTEVAPASEAPGIANPVPATVEKRQETTTRVVSFARRSPAKPSGELASPVQAAGTADAPETQKTAASAPATVGKRHETLNS